MIVINWGSTPYQQAWELQQSFIKARRQERISEDALILLEHPAVITVGRGGADEHILVDEATLRRQDCAVYHIDRGGDVTYHGPGQLVGYPLLDLRRYGKDVHDYVRKLEDVIIRTLADFGILAGRDTQYTGVWVGQEKICAIGIGMRSWLTYHGFALNVNVDLSYADLITPCGIHGRGVTSMQQLLGKPLPMEEIRTSLTKHFMAIFNILEWQMADGRFLGDDSTNPWLKGRIAGNLCSSEVYGMLEDLELNTVCAGAQCPNIGECYASRTATFMILGSQCTRNCRFCAVPKGKVQPVDEDEPRRIAEMVRHLGLKYVVITAVTRDDLPDGGAAHFAHAIEWIRKLMPDIAIEVLIPDLRGDYDALDVVIAANPEVLNHNIETVSSLYKVVRPEANYQRSLDVLAYVKRRAPHIATKSGIMVGLGETPAQIATNLADLRGVGCDMLTIGQYLSPSPKHLPVKEYVLPAQFSFYETLAYALGFSHAACGPRVRSSYRAAEGFKQTKILN